MVEPAQVNLATLNAEDFRNKRALQALISNMDFVPLNRETLIKYLNYTAAARQEENAKPSLKRDPDLLGLLTHAHAKIHTLLLGPWATRPIVKTGPTPITEPQIPFKVEPLRVGEDTVLSPGEYGDAYKGWGLGGDNLASVGKAWSGEPLSPKDRAALGDVLSNPNWEKSAQAAGISPSEWNMLVKDNPVKAAKEWRDGIVKIAKEGGDKGKMAKGLLHQIDAAFKDVVVLSGRRVWQFGVEYLIKTDLLKPVSPDDLWRIRLLTGLTCGVVGLKAKEFKVDEKTFELKTINTTINARTFEGLLGAEITLCDSAGRPVLTFTPRVAGEYVEIEDVRINNKLFMEAGGELEYWISSHASLAFDASYNFALDSGNEILQQNLLDIGLSYTVLLGDSFWVGGRGGVSLYPDDPSVQAGAERFKTPAYFTASAMFGYRTEKVAVGVIPQVIYDVKQKELGSGAAFHFKYGPFFLRGGWDPISGYSGKIGAEVPL